MPYKDGDTIIYYRGPVYATLPFGEGDYTSPWCEKCLFMNKYTGKLDLQKTEAGIYYPVTYQNIFQTITVNVIVSGVRYRDGIYKLETAARHLKPYYNASNELAPQGSYFDTPPSDWPSLRAQGVAIDASTGIIDLDKTINNGALQGQNSKSFRMYYRLNDESNFTLNHTDITITFSPLSKARRTAAANVLSDERCRTNAEGVK